MLYLFSFCENLCFFVIFLFFTFSPTLSQKYQTINNPCLHIFHIHAAFIPKNLHFPLPQYASTNLSHAHTHNGEMGGGVGTGAVWGQLVFIKDK